MKAMTYTQYGSPSVLTLSELEQPTPEDHQVLVEIKAASVNSGDYHLLTGTPFLVRAAYGFFKPKHTILGSDMAGIVRAVDQNVTTFEVGDEVFANLADYGFGAFAEFVCVDAKALVHKPSSLSFEQVAAIPNAATTALQGLRDLGQLSAGQKVLINGASGGVGTYAVQIAKALGAEVTAVCSTTKLEMVREIGADHVLDYSKQDPTKLTQRFDLIFDVAAFRSFLEFKPLLKPQGRYVMAGGAIGNILQMLFLGSVMGMTGQQKFLNLLVKPNTDDLKYLVKLLETGVIAPVIEKEYTLLELPEALTYLGLGHAKGKLIIKI